MAAPGGATRSRWWTSRFLLPLVILLLNMFQSTNRISTSDFYPLPNKIDQPVLTPDEEDTNNNNDDDNDDDSNDEDTNSGKSYNNLNVKRSKGVSRNQYMGMLTPHHRILDSLSLIGERHSGTKFVMNVLKECFPRVIVRDALVVHKHWFQPSPAYIQKTVEKYGRAGLGGTRTKHTRISWWDIAAHPNPETIFNNTLVVCMFRNPYDWLDGMRIAPYHWPLHQHYDLFSKTVKENNEGDERASQDRKERLSNMKEMLLSQMQGSSRRHENRNDDSDRRGAYPPDKNERIALREKELAEIRVRKARNKVQERRRSFGRAASESSQPRRRRRLDEYLRTKWRKSKRPLYKSIPLDWNEFVATNLTLGGVSAQGIKGHVCQKGFEEGGVSPCVRSRRYVPPELEMRQRARSLPYGANDPVYEHRKDGTPFANPLQLRAAKIRNFMNLPRDWELGGFLPVRYEDVVERGMSYLVEVVAKKVGVAPRCSHEELKKSVHAIPHAFRNWITENTDWEAEALIGYKRQQQ